MAVFILTSGGTAGFSTRKLPAMCGSDAIARCRTADRIADPRRSGARLHAQRVLDECGPAHAEAEPGQHVALPVVVGDGFAATVVRDCEVAAGIQEAFDAAWIAVQEVFGEAGQALVFGGGVLE